MVITQNGEARMIMGVEEYDRLQGAFALLKIIRLSEADVRKQWRRHAIVYSVWRMLQPTSPRLFDLSRGVHH